MTNEILQPNQPAKFAARNLLPKFRRLKSGDIFTIDCEVEESVWNILRTVPENALLEIVLWHHSGDDGQASQPTVADKVEPESREKGAYSRYWQYLFKHGFNNFPDLLTVLDLEDGREVRGALHKVFDRESLAMVGPREWEGWLESNSLTSLITLSRTAEQSAMEG